MEDTPTSACFGIHSSWDSPVQRPVQFGFVYLLTERSIFKYFPATWLEMERSIITSVVRGNIYGRAPPPGNKDDIYRHEGNLKAELRIC